MDVTRREVYNKSCDELFIELNSSNLGLNDEKIKESKKKYGENILKEKKKKNKAQVFLEQYKNLLVILLIIAAIISIFTGGIENTCVILAVITLNAFIGTYQYSKSQKSLESLKKLTKEAQRVIRNGVEQNINVSEIVVGDILLFLSGDIISADARLISASDFEVDESSLTGEAISVQKNDKIIEGDRLLADRSNIVYRGSKVVSGKAMAICYAVGMNTEIGKIASLMEETEDTKSPLEKDIDVFSRNLAFIIVSICIIVFFICLYNHVKLIDSLMFSIALAVAAIPEALFTIITIVLAIGTEKMAKEKAIVKDIKAVETLGCVNVIATDKTGTITENKMKVTKLFVGEREVTKIKQGSFFEYALALCNDSSIIDIDGDTIKTDTSILSFLIENHIDVLNIRKNNSRIYEIPFSSSRKLMSTVNIVNGRRYLFSKGASEIVLKKSSRINVDNIERKINNKDIENIKYNIDKYSNEGLRVLAVAYKNITFKDMVSEKDEYDYTFLGLIALSDPPKDGVKEAIEECKKLNIKPVMITGDHIGTAKAIGKQVGINENAIISDSYKNKDIKEIDIFARVSPQDKIEIVSKIQESGNVVAYVGDGVNDAPALRKSDIGISMGISGTDVSKEASSIILMDDNYQTIVNSIKRGRGIYDNIQNVILYLISGNIAGILMVLFTSILDLPMPFAPVHLLFINLINDSLPAIGIGVDDNIGDKDLRPRKTNQKILNISSGTKMLFEGAIIAFCTACAFLIGLETSIYVARTMSFLVLALGRLLHSFNCRGGKTVFDNFVYNKTLSIAIFVGVVLINLLILIEPLQQIFIVSDLDQLQIVLVYFLSIIPTFFIQILLMIKKIFKKSK